MLFESLADILDELNSHSDVYKNMINDAIPHNGSVVIALQYLLTECNYSIARNALTGPSKATATAFIEQYKEFDNNECVLNGAYTCGECAMQAVTIMEKELLISKESLQEFNKQTLTLDGRRVRTVDSNRTFLCISERPHVDTSASHRVCF
jgi:hypothetical protein